RRRDRRGSAFGVRCSGPASPIGRIRPIGPIRTPNTKRRTVLIGRHSMSIEATIDPSTLRLFYNPPGTLRLTIDDERSYHTVKLYQAWPLSQPSQHIVLQDGKGEEIAMVEALDELTTETRAVAEEELRRRYLTARIEAI